MVDRDERSLFEMISHRGPWQSSPPTNEKGGGEEKKSDQNPTPSPSPGEDDGW